MKTDYYNVTENDGNVYSLLVHEMTQYGIRAHYLVGKDKSPIKQQPIGLWPMACIKKLVRQKRKKA
jgi:hypothetical protein